MLPSLGENVTEATISRWLVQRGDPVEAGEPLLEVATDKVDTEIPSPVTGILVDTLVAEDTVVAVGAALATIGTPVEPVASPEPPAPAAEDPVESRSQPLAAPATDRVVTLPRIRRTIARRMRESLDTSAQLTTVVEVDLTAIARLRDAEKQEFARRTGVRLSFLPFVATAAVGALGEHPIVNASVDNACTELTYHDAVHLGMAVDSAKGLMVPVIRHADELGITEIAIRTSALADRVRAGTIGADDLTGGTFTITNTGSRGALFDTPIINRPQSAILGVGAVVERLIPLPDTNGALQIGVRSMAYLSLTYDHRIIDGADAARYLGAVRGRLETGFDPAQLR
ncbi:2-oxo acid dehydrogenase subunit E2 [Nocardia sp. CA-135398]|uniref:2-oxo acid dehydrogenase subunit E2 n=1 Tax=Nocardia sp. CA-135398 TaxID=3239977 RepID=UPI003D97F782